MTICSRRRAFGPAFAATGLLTLAACAPPAGGPDDGPGDGPGDVATAEQRYQVTATVLDSGDGPRLCHAVMDSYPPQCGGPLVDGWDWGAVPHESAMDTRWGGYVLVGTWDGERFTLTEPARGAEAADHPGLEVDLSSPCPEPDGGWRPVDPATATAEAQRAALERAAGAPDYAGAWLDRSGLLDPGHDRGDPTDAEDDDRGEPADFAGDDPARVVLNLRFTGDLAEREAWIREVWGGPLCVTAATHTEQELHEIQREVHERTEVLSAGMDVTANAVRVTVYVADEELRSELDDRYGPDAVIVDGWLQPVD